VAVVDAGSGRGRFARDLWRAADALLVVTTPDAASIRECYAAIKVLLDTPAASALQILVNLAESSAVAVDVHARIDAACRRFLGWQALSAGYVEPCSASRPEDGVLVYPARSISARALDRMADTLWAQWQQQRKRHANGTSSESTGSASEGEFEMATTSCAERAKSNSVGL
jgi:MinD-like ATPase involved in chromosome partitioning or flagellar assembly